MRITLLSARMDLSGGSRIIATYARMLQAHGHQVTVVAYCPPPPSLKRRVKHLLSTGHWDPENGNRSHYDGLGLDIRQVRHMPFTDDDVPDADVVVATWWETAEWANGFSPRKGAKVYFVQGHEVFDFLPVERARATYHMPFQKIVVSGWLQRIMAREYGDTSAVLVPNAVDHAVFHASPRGKQPVPTVGFAYAPGHLKGSDVTAEALRRIRRVLPDTRIVSFGSHPMTSIEGLRGIEFHHAPPQSVLRDCYASCDVWLCSSRSEGFGLPAMEAMACRTPVVSSDVGWPQDAIENGRNGFVVPIGDANAAAERALEILRCDDTRWRAMSDAAHATATAHDWNSAYAQFAAALEVAARTRRAGLPA